MGESICSGHQRNGACSFHLKVKTQSKSGKKMISFFLIELFFDSVCNGPNTNPCQSAPVGVILVLVQLDRVGVRAGAEPVG